MSSMQRTMARHMEREGATATDEWKKANPTADAEARRANKDYIKKRKASREQSKLVHAHMAGSSGTVRSRARGDR